MPYTATQIITNAAHKLGYLEAGETMTANDLDACFEAANAWLDSLGIRRTMIFLVDRVVHALVSGTPSYTIGSGGDINRARPVWIDDVSVLTDDTATDPVETPIGPPITVQRWQGISMKTTQGSWPDVTYYDHNWSAGLGRLYVYPIPNQSNSSLVLYLPTPVTEFADKASTQYTFPPGFRRALEHNLALEIAPVLDVMPSDDVRRIAQESLFDFEVANFRPSELIVDPFGHARRGRYNIESDGY